MKANQAVYDLSRMLEKINWAFWTRTLWVWISSNMRSVHDARDDL